MHQPFLVPISIQFLSLLFFFSLFTSLALAQVCFLFLFYFIFIFLLCCEPGNYDIIQQPKNISEAAKRNVCFYMFVDEETEAGLKYSGSIYSTNRVGLWRVVVVRNIPYTDPRRTGKVSSFQDLFSLYYNMPDILKQILQHGLEGIRFTRVVGVNS